MLWLLCLLTTAILTTLLVKRRSLRGHPLWRIGAAISALSLVGTAALMPPPMVLQKLIANLIMPQALAWCLLIYLTVRLWKNRSVRYWVLATLLLYSLAGNRMLGSALLAWLEKDYVHINPLEQGSFDAVFVLGGGSDLTPDGRPQLGSAGDRIAVGAAVYHNGQTPILVCSGHSISGLENSRDLTVETRVLWKHMGVPDAAIMGLNWPRNTSEEMTAYAQLVQEKGWKRVGLITSSFHLRRAMKLARKKGLVLTPLPAELHEVPPWSVLALIPQSGGFDATQAAFWELVGAAVGR